MGQNTGRHWIRAGARVLGAVGGAFAMIPTGGIVNPFTGWRVGGTIADTAAPDKEIKKNTYSVADINPYYAGLTHERQDSRIKKYSYMTQDKQDFNKGIGMLDTAIGLAGTIGGDKLATGASKAITGALKGGGTATSSLIDNAANVLKIGSNTTGISDVIAPDPMMLEYGQKTIPKAIDNTGLNNSFDFKGISKGLGSLNINALTSPSINPSYDYQGITKGSGSLNSNPNQPIISPEIDNTINPTSSILETMAKYIPMLSNMNSVSPYKSLAPYKTQNIYTQPY